jgi:hypothetical protein
MLPVGFSSADFISLLAGTLIPAPAQASLVSSWGDKTAIDIAPDGLWADTAWRVNLAAGPNGTRIEGFTANLPDGPPIVASYSQFVPQKVDSVDKTVDFPNRVEMSWGRGQNVLVRYDEVRLGFAAQPDMFSTKVPSGFTKVDL